MKCVERYCELATNNATIIQKVTTPYMDDHQFRKEENGSVGKLSTLCSEIVLKCIWLVLGDLIFCGL